MSALQLLLPEGRLVRWHQTLIDKLAGDGHQVSVELCAPKQIPGVALQLVEHLEKLLYRRDQTGAFDAIESIGPARHPMTPVDLLFDLTGDPEPHEGAITPLYDGHVGDIARDFALLDGRTPEITLVATNSGLRDVLARGWPANERPASLASGRAAVSGCIVALVRAASRGRAALAAKGEAARPQSVAKPGFAKPNLAKPMAFLLSGVVNAARRRIARIVAREGHWRIGWRALDGAPSTMEALAWPSGQPWRWLPDDGRRYFADPFLFRDGETTYIFCEEYPYGTCKGIISVCTIDAKGRASAPRPVLERPYHLSYPVVFRHQDRIWMMPESSANGTLELYIAESFPDRWTLHSTLLSNLSVSDATMFQYRGRWLMTAAVAEPYASTWDSLAVFTGESPIGPWRRNSDWPVLVDVSAARPAGNVVCHDGVYLRPAQDCMRGYGSGIAICRIDELDDGVLRQSVIRRLGSPDGAPDQGVHTLNSDGRIEVIDAVGSMSRFNWRSQEVA